MDLIELLRLSVEKNASDLHLSSGESPIFRINGDLIHANDFKPLSAEMTQQLIDSILTNEQKKELVSSLEIDFSFAIPDYSRFRVNVFNQAKGLSAVFRIIPNKIPTLDELQFPMVFKQLLDLPNGLILVTGPTGSGKSTTLAAMVNEMNTHMKYHIITIEDPIEFMHQSKNSLINQREVKRDTHDFNIALRSSLREDPDVILVGEMRDLETIRLALTAAETGHLVLATLHTASAPRAISRIIDAFPTGEKNIIRNMLSESLQAVICQTLLNKIPEGRIAAFEIMLGTTAIRNLIREDKVAQMYSTIQIGSELGMCTFDQYIQKLMNKNLIKQTSVTEILNNQSLFQIDKKNKDKE